ncbi:MAG: DNA replication complex GINS family protein [Candidatus Bathyarchaeota archaeon]|nr:MAG: DNA replication complex GINS family protein [Candidatus Bathyarchaeota archaeon]
MSAKASITDEDFVFENTPVRIIVNRKCPEIELAGLKIGSFQEGKEYEVRFWIAEELEKAGITRFREEEMLDAMKLHKIHWKERVQSVKQISSLRKDFYPRLRRYLSSLREDAVKKPEKMKEYERVSGLSRDIVDCRLKKIISLASTSAQTEQFLKSMTREERAIYKRLHKRISNWRKEILKLG